MVRIICFFIFILGASSSQSAVYKCIDEQGELTFADRPCKGIHTTQEEITKVSDKTADFYGISAESEINITPKMHKLLDLMNRGRTAINICRRKNIHGDHRMMFTVSAWEDKNKKELDSIAELLNSSDSTAYQLNLISMMNEYEENIKRQIPSGRLEICNKLMVELETN